MRGEPYSSNCDASSMNAKQVGILDHVSVELSALDDGNQSRNLAHK